MLQHSYAIPAASTQYAVFDNLLLVFTEAAAVYVIDVDATANMAVSGPQPFHMAQWGVRTTVLLTEASRMHCGIFTARREAAAVLTLHRAIGMPM